MAKGDFWFKLDWGDWLGDENLSKCSLETQGFWMRCVCIMNKANASELSGTPDQLRRQIGCLPDELLRCCNELKETNSADVMIGNDFVMLLSRRRKRELKHNESNRLAVARHREKSECNADVMGQSKSKSKSKSKNISNDESVVAVETASPTATSTKKPKLSDQEWLESLKTKPAYKNLNIEIEYSRAEVWADANNRQCTRRFFTNWLNRAKPMETGFNGNGNHQFNKPSQMQQPRNELEFQKMLGEQKPK